MLKAGNVTRQGSTSFCLFAAFVIVTPHPIFQGIVFMLQSLFFIPFLRGSRRMRLSSRICPPWRWLPGSRRAAEQCSPLLLFAVCISACLLAERLLPCVRRRRAAGAVQPSRESSPLFCDVPDDLFFLKVGSLLTRIDLVVSVAFHFVVSIDFGTLSEQASLVRVSQQLYWYYYGKVLIIWYYFGKVLL